MTIEHVSQPRKDGKYMVRISFSGGPNAFGGLNHGKIFRKLVDRAGLDELKRIEAASKNFGAIS